MVSGFLTSPCDHSRIFSGLASEMRMAEKDSGSFGFSKKEKMSRIVGLLVLITREKTWGNLGSRHTPLVLGLGPKNLGVGPRRIHFGGAGAEPPETARPRRTESSAA